MSTANSSVAITPGGGATIASQLVGGKSIQVVAPADAQGHILGSRDIYLAYFVPAANATSRRLATMFNGAGSGAIIRVHGLYLEPTWTTITGAPIGWNLNRTSAVGTGGVTTTPYPLDTAAAAIPAQIDARSDATGGATVSAVLCARYMFNDETNAGHATNTRLPLLAYDVDLILREGEGFLIDQNVASAVGLCGATAYFSLE